MKFEVIRREKVGPQNHRNSFGGTTEDARTSSHWTQWSSLGIIFSSSSNLQSHGFSVLQSGCYGLLWFWQPFRKCFFLSNPNLSLLNFHLNAVISTKTIQGKSNSGCAEAAGRWVRVCLPGISGNQVRVVCLVGGELVTPLFCSWSQLSVSC